MKLINSKEYNIDTVLKEGQCMLCGKTLMWDMNFYLMVNVEKTSTLTSATCCNFAYLLEGNDNQDTAKVIVRPE